MGFVSGYFSFVLFPSLPDGLCFVFGVSTMNTLHHHLNLPPLHPVTHTDPSVQPTSLTLVASCSANGNTYPIGPTGSSSNTLPANATQVIWNPWQWEQIPGQVPFAEATYVLQIYDERGPGVGIKGGYLSPYSGTQFSMYRPAKYQSIAGES